MTGKELRRLRTAAAMSQVALARYWDYSRGTINDYEQGRRPIPKMVAIAARVLPDPTERMTRPYVPLPTNVHTEVSAATPSPPSAAATPVLSGNLTTSLPSATIGATALIITGSDDL